MDSSSKTKLVVVGLAAFALGMFVGDIRRQYKVFEKIEELYEEGGCFVGPDDNKKATEVEYTIIE